jgi:hypothetical protein
MVEKQSWQELAIFAPKVKGAAIIAERETGDVAHNLKMGTPCAILQTPPPH